MLNNDLHYLQRDQELKMDHRRHSHSRHHGYCRLLPSGTSVEISSRLSMTWFDFLFIIFGWSAGNYLFNNFEKHLSWHRRIQKLLVMIGILYLIGLLGREFLYAVLAIMIIGMTYLHAVWFPKKGINGMTAEPYEHYLSVIKKN